jgi:hypothetical protein
MMVTPQRTGAGTDLYATWVAIAFGKEFKLSILSEWNVKQRPQELTYLSCRGRQVALWRTL